VAFERGELSKPSFERERSFWRDASACDNCNLMCSDFFVRELYLSIETLDPGTKMQALFQAWIVPLGFMTLLWVCIRIIAKARRKNG